MAFVHYCDLCNTAMKDVHFYTLYCSSPDIYMPDVTKYEKIADFYKDYIAYACRVSKDIKEVCPSCKKLFDEIFKYRKEKLKEMTDACSDLFNLPCKKDKKKKDK